jgi:hypothetical protein
MEEWTEGTWFSRALSLLFFLFALSLIGRTRCARYILYLSRLSLMGRTSNHTRFCSIARAARRRQRRLTLAEC